LGVEAHKLKPLLLRSLNKNQLLILRELALNFNRSLTSFLMEISEKRNIPLSTLKLNAKVLRNLGLICVGELNGKRFAGLSNLGRLVLNILDGVEDSRGDLRRESIDIDFLRRKTDLVRKHIIRMLRAAGSGHLGGSLSIVEVLVALYFAKMAHDPSNPSWKGRDILILSKGHAAPALYAVLAEAGYIPLSLLSRLRELGSPLQGHPELTIPGIEMVSGSLGQGLSIGVGIALGMRLRNTNSRVYVILGDGELNEGQIWEACMTASKYQLDNLTAIVDRNRFQQEGLTEEVKPLEPLDRKWEAFGWNVLEIDGHNMEQILWALDEVERVWGRPSVIIAKTKKGKGVPEAEGNNHYHSRVPL